MYNQLKDVLSNKATPDTVENIACDECFEPLLFHLKDSKGYEFSLGVISVLEMLESAVKEGVLPKLPQSWCKDVENLLRVSFDDEATYYDYKNFKIKG